MQIYKINKNTKTIIFDIDGTLYTSDEFVKEQVDIQIRHYSDINNISHEQGRRLINDFRENWKNEHNGAQISLGNTLTHFGITIEESINWRNTLVEPSLFLKQNEQLIQCLKTLSKNFNLIAVTNNPIPAARKILSTLGVNELIQNIVGLDTCYQSKPSLDLLNQAVKIVGSKYEECLSVGDRFDIDVSLPLELGMGGIVVDGVEDVYKLPELLKF